MTALAGGRQGPVPHERLAVGPRPRLVARRTRYRGVRALELERGVAIVSETSGRLERIHRVTAVATGAIGELPPMGIGVTVGAPGTEWRELHRCLARPGEHERRRPRLRSLELPVTPHTRNRAVGALQREAEPLVRGC